MGSHEEPQMLVVGQAEPENDDYETWPALPRSVDEVLTDSIVKHHFRRPQQQPVHVTTSALVAGAWAIVASQMTSSEGVMFDMTMVQDLPGAVDEMTSPVSKMVPLRIKAAAYRSVSDHLQAAQSQIESKDLSHENGTQHKARIRASSHKARKSQTLMVLVQSRQKSFDHDVLNGEVNKQTIQKFKSHAVIVELRLTATNLMVTTCFDSRIVERWIMQKLLQRFELVIQQFCALHVESPLADLSIITEQDSSEIWARNGIVPSSVERCFHQVVEEIAQRQPNAPAICAWDGELTYSELNSLAAKLAGVLVTCGVGKDALVPLCFEKSLWTTVAILGVIKTGAAFTLLDPALPEQRLRAIVKQTKTRLIVCAPSTKTLSSRLAGKVVSIDHEYLANLADKTIDISYDQKASSLMYVTFTSGSTGTPKGVMISHQNVTSGLYHQLGVIGIKKSSRILDFASYSYAAAIANLCVALGAGACLCVPHDQDRKDKLPEVMRSFRVTTIDLAPSTAQFLVNQSIPTLQLITYGGEPLHARDIEPWWNSGVRTMNIYGQSECTSYSTINENPSSPEEAAGIGRGVGLNTWVVDPENDQRLLPIGCVGELLLEGPLVGQGYLDEPDKTSEVFIRDPNWLLRGSSQQSGRCGRLYKTGDLVRYNQDGTLVYLGRKDAQVKIRGQRLELREVEHWVQHCAEKCVSGVEQVVAEVIVPTGSGANPMLAAFLRMIDDSIRASGTNIAAAEILPNTSQLEKQLAEHLPSYMIPTVFFSISKLPTTATGKTDRKRLRQIGSSFSTEQLAEMRRNRKGEQRKPTSRLERCMQQVWAHVLNMDPDKIGLDDHFFHLGGDSIASMKVIADARKFDITVTVALIFSHPVLNDLTDQIVSMVIEPHHDLAPFALLHDRFEVPSFLGRISEEYHLNSTAIQDAYPCTGLQEGFIFLSSKRPGDYVMQSILEFSPDVEVKKMVKAWDQVVENTPILRTRIVQQDDVRLFQIVLDEPIQWNYASDLSRYLERDRSNPMSLGQKLSRYALVKDKTGTVRWMVWTIHHALYDGWSIPLIRDTVYRAYHGEMIEPAGSFQPFIQYITDQDRENGLQYWKQAFSDYETTPFPTLPQSIKEPVANKVIDHCLPLPKNKSLGITASLLIRAAWALVVGQMSNSQDVVFGVTVSGRNAPVIAIDKLTGPTIATVPVRVQWGPELTVLQYLESVQRQATEMIPFEQAGLQEISRICPENQSACQFQNLLVIQPQDYSISQDEFGTWRDGNQEAYFSTYALTLELWLGSNDVTALATFDTDVIKPWVVEMMLKRLEHVITQFDQSTPSKLLAEIELSTPQDWAQIQQWNHSIPEPVNTHVHELIEGKARSQPHAPAVCAWDGDLTYSELDRFASVLASKLLEMGVGRNVLVPLCFEKSMWTTVAILGIMKAGGSFVMLDPSLPEQRLLAILRQVKPEIILCSERHSNLCSQHARRTVIVDSDLSHQSNNSEARSNCEVDPSSIIYVTFTSGSTGTPKGVVVTYMNLAAAVHYQAELMGLTEKSRLFDFASYSFDGSISNMFNVLGVGGCLCVPSDQDRKNNLEQSIVSLRANALDLTPSVGQLLSPERIPEVRTVIFAGEALHVADVKRWWGRVKVCNAYGPSECSPTSTVNPEVSSIEGTTSIGRGAGLLTWIVDPKDHDQLLPPGCVGELLLEGPLVGIGYLGDPDKTAAVFIEDPAWLLNGINGSLGRRGRLYKTGDLVRYDEDGSLIFIDRKDEQVKIRGQRVELKEIEHVLRSHTLVDDAVVLVQQADGRNSDIVSFVAMRKDGLARVASKTSDPDESKIVKVWGEHFDAETYTLLDNVPSGTVGKDFVGWTSMYNGEEIKKEEMNEWLDDTITTLLDGQSPKDVLEIGTGSGMILFNLTEGLQSYVGLEPSGRAVEFVSRSAHSMPKLAGKVSMFKATAADLGQLSIPISPNLVIANSVIQYFPSQDYLLQVIQDLIKLPSVRTIFFGDVRSYALYKEFLLTKVLHITGENVSKEQVRRIMNSLQETEAELLVNPAFFTSLASKLPGKIDHVEIVPKQMRATNELSCYRYAAIIHVARQDEPRHLRLQEVEQDDWIDFTERQLDGRSLSQLLQSQIAPATVAISNIPYSKTMFERYALNSLEKTGVDASNDNNWLSKIRQAVNNCSSLSPTDLTELALQAGYKVEISWARQGSQFGGLDAIFHRHKPVNGEDRVKFRFPVDHGDQSQHSYTTQPLWQQLKQKTKDELYEILRSDLPSYMVPQTLTILDKIPINQNGKVDRRMLLNMHSERVSKPEAMRQPTTNTERQIQTIWCQVLGLKPDVVGLDSNFFELGGNSIAAMKIVAEAKKAGLDFTIANIFSHAKLENFAKLAHTSSKTDLMAAISRYDTRAVDSLLKGKASVSGTSGKAERNSVRVLLTGANGFVGTQILRQLLEHRQVDHVVALVRGKSANTARVRTIDAARKARWWTEFHDERLEVWQGDLSMPHLGLDADNWSKLANGKAIDVVIHNGAVVHMMKSYASLEAANVKSTAELVSVVDANPSMRLVYVSSARCEDPTQEQEDKVSQELATTASGYIQTKFVAETLVKRARFSSPSGRDQFAIVSPGLVIGTPTEGVSNADDWVWRLTAGCIKAGVYNADGADQWIAISDAGHTATAIIDTALDKASPGVLTQVRGGMTWRAFWTTLKSQGYQLEPRDGHEWAATIRKDIKAEQEAHPLWALADMLEDLSIDADAHWANSWQETGGFQVRLQVAISKSVEFLAEVGFLPSPPLSGEKKHASGSINGMATGAFLRTV